MKQITYTRTAMKGLKKIGNQAARRVVDKIEQYASDPASLANNVTPLVGEDGLFRLRVADWRVIFTEDMTVLMVLKVGHRKEIY